jgi:hypothetical protein
MQTFRPLVFLAMFAFAGCSASVTPLPTSGGGATAAAASPALAVSHRPAREKYGRLVFRITIPHKRHPRRAHYIPASAQSITITLDTVNGGAPPVGVATSVNDNLTNCAVSCTITGPYSPPGSDKYTVTIFGGPVGNPGPELSTATQTFTIVTGSANSPSITLEGVPAKFALHDTMPAGSGGTALAATALPIDVEDADGDVITGTYSTPVTLSDPDATSLTGCNGPCGSALQLGSGTAAKSVVLASSTDAGNVQITYGGMDVAPAALAGSTPAGDLAASGSVTFSPSVAPIVYVGPLVGIVPEIDLYAPLGAGTGSTGSYTDSQAGWTNAPYSQAIAEGDNCSSIATFAQNAVTNGTAWTATAVASPTAGTCADTLTGGGGATLAVITTYTSSGIGVSIHGGRYSSGVTPKRP